MTDVARLGLRAAIGATRPALRLTAAIVLSAIVLAPGRTQHAAQSTQHPEQRPVFRGGANLVQVDVYPRRDGRIVEDLTADDFQILEDGKPQAVDAFELVRFAANAPDTDRRDPNSVGESERLAADPHYRLFVIYLDRYHTTIVGSHEARRPVVQFLDRVIGASDLFGVMTSQTPPARLTFGQRLETVENELAKYWTWGSKEGDHVPENSVDLQTPLEQRLWECYITRYRDPEANQRLVRRLVLLARQDALFGSLEALTIRLRSLRDGRKNVLLLTEGWALGGRQEDLPVSAWGATPTVGVTPGGTLTLGATRDRPVDRSACDTDLLRLAGIDFDRRFRDLLTEAGRADVSFYPVDLGGLRAGATYAAQKRDQTVVSILQTLAENTDGKAVVNRNDLAAGLREIGDTLSWYYLLGYYSTNATFDGRFRRIEVKLKRPGVSVSARRGYLAPTAAMVRAMEAGTSAAPPAPAGASLVDAALAVLARARPSAEVLTHASVDTGEIAFAVELASRVASTAPWSAGAAVQIAVSAGSEPAITAVGRIEPGLRSVLIRVPIGPASTGPWRATVSVSSGRDGLSDRLDVTAPANRLVGEPLVFRATPAPASPLRPVADFQYRRTERVHVEWRALGSLDRREARLLGRNGQPLPIPITLTERDSGGRSVIAADLNLAPLSAGDYVIDLTVGRGDVTERKLVAIRVVQ